MNWNCKLCGISLSSKTHLRKHCRLKHSHFCRVSPLPCLYADCICTFQSFGALKTHLSRYHTAESSFSKGGSLVRLSLKCSLCTFQQPFSESIFFSHLRGHLRNHETVTCPYKDCNYSTNVYSSFNAHKSRVHHTSDWSDFCDEVIIPDDSHPICTSEISSDVCEDLPAQNEAEDQFDRDALTNQLKLNLASLFLKMQAILHVSNTATEEIAESLNQLCSLSQPLIKQAVSEVLQRNGHAVTDSTLDKVINAVMESNVLFSATSKGADLSSPERLSRWPPGIFPVPNFSFDVELRLRAGSEAFQQNGKHLKLTRDQKQDILDKLASTIYGFKAYPCDKEIAQVAEALVTKHPCLKEAGSERGWNGWKNSIKFKLGNYRQKLRKVGCL